VKGCHVGFRRCAEVRCSPCSESEALPTIRLQSEAGHIDCRASVKSRSKHVHSALGTRLETRTHETRRGSYEMIACLALLYRAVPLDCGLRVALLAQAGPTQ
jgi:hypothetical protein